MNRLTTPRAMLNVLLIQLFSLIGVVWIHAAEWSSTVGAERRPCRVVERVCRVGFISL